MAITTIGGTINSTAVTSNLDYKYGPYSSKQEAYDTLGPNGLDKLALGLTVGILEDGAIREYWFRNSISSVDDLVLKSEGKSAYDIAVENGFEGTEQEWIDSLKGEKGDNAINPFKGWFDAVVTGEAGSLVITSETQNLPANPTVGDYAYVKTWEITGTAPDQVENPIVKIYECTTVGYWSDSGRTADTSNVQTFASGQEVNEVHIVNDMTTGGVDDVANAESVKILGDIINDTNQYTDLTIDEGYYWSTIDSSMPQSKTASSTDSAYGCIRVQCSSGDKFRIFGKGGNQYGYLWTFTDSSREILLQKNTNYYQSNGDVITAPENAYYLYVNLYQYDNLTDKVQTVVQVKGLTTRVEELEEDLYGTDVFNDVTEGFFEGRYFNMGASSSSFNPTPSTSVSRNCQLVSCLPGDTFKIYGNGNSDTLQLYAFVAADNSWVYRPQKSIDAHVNGIQVIAPANSAWLAVNYMDYDSSTDKIQKLVHQDGVVEKVSDLDSRMEALEETTPVVVDNLDSNSTTDALSANQGFVLNTYSNGLAGLEIQDVPSHSTINNMLKGVVKRVWLEVPNDSIILPQALRLYGIRNRSEGNGNNFIMQFCDAQNFTDNAVIFNGSTANKLIGKNSVIINGLSSFSGVKIHIDLDFTEYTDDYNAFGNLSDLYLYSEDLNRKDVYTESVKEALLRVDTEVYNNSSVKYPLGNIIGVGTMGASLMYNGNNWVEDGCKLCGVTSYNKAESGVGVPSYFADKIWRGTYCTDEEFEAMDILAIQFASSGDVYTGTFFDTLAEYVEDFDIEDETNQFAMTYTAAQCLDYILKYWQERCYADRNNPSSKWYGTQYGKPCRLMFVTHWHDARVPYNDSIRLVAAKWGGGICEFDKKIGFSKNQTINGLQPSVIFANETQNIDGVDYGWHPLRGSAGAYIQTKMANIFASSLMEYFSMN